MIYSHLAREPPKVPFGFCLSEVIYKLMAKPPGDRYQSAEGILKDLEHCKGCLLNGEHNPSHIGFVPGRHDISSVFRIPSKLYGREKEHKQLMDCVEYAKQHKEVFYFRLPW